MTIKDLTKEELVSRMNKYQGQILPLEGIHSFEQFGRCTGYHRHLTNKQTKMFLSQILTEINRSIEIENEERSETYRKLEARFLEITSNQNHE